jgi:hypothetical protein
MDSAQHVEKFWNIANVPYFILGAIVYRLKIVKLESRPSLKNSKSSGFHLARNTLLGQHELKYFLLIACMIDYMLLLMNFALNEHPLARCQLRQSKLFLSYQQHAALVIHSLKFFLANKSVPSVGKLTLFVLRAIDPVNLGLPQALASLPILVFGALV